MNPLVTILTPAYNEEKNIDRFLESVFNQTYNNIELILINDGSTDNTERVFYSYKGKLEEKGIKIKYFYQDNSGQAAAINLGLKHVTGKYLAWPDADDELLSTAIEEKVDFLEKNSDCKVVFNEAYVLDENTKKIKGHIKLKDINLDDKDLVKEFIKLDNIYSASGCYLIDFEAFIEANNGKDIFVHKSGQNWQMQIPMAKYYKFGYIPKPLYNYYFSHSSHSNKHSTEEMRIKQQEGYYDLLKNVLIIHDLLSDENKKILEEDHSRKKLNIYFKYFNKEKFLDEYKKTKENGTISFKEKIMRAVINFKFIHNFMYKTYNMMKNK